MINFKFTYPESGQPARPAPPPLITSDTPRSAFVSASPPSCAPIITTPRVRREIPQLLPPPPPFRVLHIKQPHNCDFAFATLEGVPQQVFCSPDLYFDPETKEKRQVRVGDHVQFRSNPRGLRVEAIVQSSVEGYFGRQIPTSDMGPAVPLPDDCGLIPVEEFFAAAREHSLFAPEDGHGFYATDMDMSSLRADLDDLRFHRVPHWATHIAWYTSLTAAA